MGAATQLAAAWQCWLKDVEDGMHVHAAVFNAAPGSSGCSQLMAHRVPPPGPQTDVWSFGILAWELSAQQDITRYQPLAVTRLGGSSQASRPTITMPPAAPQLARHIFATCTQMDPELRPNAAQLVEWLRGGKVCSCCAV